ncbi:hypothetical protein WJ973_24025 [Achromobacter xylosoxidans]
MHLPMAERDRPSRSEASVKLLRVGDAHECEHVAEVVDAGGGEGRHGQFQQERGAARLATNRPFCLFNKLLYQ